MKRSVIGNLFFFFRRILDELNEVKFLFVVNDIVIIFFSFVKFKIIIV